MFCPTAIQIQRKRVGKVPFEQFRGSADLGEIAVAFGGSQKHVEAVDAVEQLPCRCRVGAEPMIEMIADRALDQPRGLNRGEPLLGLPLELRIAQKQR